MQLFVSCTLGDDEHAGVSSAKPLRTIGRARDIARKFLASGYAGDITVWIGGGRYELTEPLRFDERDSAGEGSTVTYRSIPGEEAVLCGGRAIAAWEHVGGGIYRARLGDGTTVHALYENGKRAVSACSPKTGYHVVAGKSDGASGSGFRFTAGDVPRFDFEPEGAAAQVHIWPGEGEWNWFTETKTIAGIDWEEGVIAFREAAPWGIDQGSRYRVQNALALLTEPGEFVVDARLGELYYMPRQLPIEEQLIVAPAAARVIELRGSSPRHPVKGISIEGLTLECSDFAQEYRMPRENCEYPESRHGLVYMENAVGNAVKGCAIRNSGFSGVVLNGFCQHNRVTDNLVEHLGYNGVYLLGVAPGEGEYGSAAEADVCRLNLISNNLIRHGGEVVGHGSGIQLYQSGSNEISHNEIHGMPRYGISLKGLRQGIMASSYYGTGVSWDNHWDFLHTRNNVITFNDIWDVMKDSQDGGMLEAWGAGRGNRIVANRFHHSGIYFSFGFCIYLDDASDDTLVSHNVIHDLFSAGRGVLWFVVFAKGIGNRIENNLLVDNDARAAFGTQEMAGEANRDIAIVRNIVCRSGEQLYHFVNWSDDRLSEADLNLYWSGGGGKQPTVSGIYGDDKRGLKPVAWEEWQSWMKGRFDAQTLYADPLLRQVGEAGGEQARFELDPASPAFGLGFEAIDMARIGLKSGFPFKRWIS